jgi:hypothetical protein
MRVVLSAVAPRIGLVCLTKQTQIYHWLFAGMNIPYIFCCFLKLNTCYCIL